MSIENGNHVIMSVRPRLDYSGLCAPAKKDVETTQQNERVEHSIGTSLLHQSVDTCCDGTSRSCFSRLVPHAETRTTVRRKVEERKDPIAFSSSRTNECCECCSPLSVRGQFISFHFISLEQLRLSLWNLGEEKATTKTMESPM